MKIIAKVIDDNGYKLELIRPLRDYPLHIGTTVEVMVCPKQMDLIAMFNNLLDDETKDMIIGKFNEARKPEPAGLAPMPVPTQKDKRK